MRFRGRRTGNADSGELGRTVLYAAIVAALLVSSVAMTSSLRNLDISPKVGDILVFRPNMHMATDWAFEAARAIEPSVSCVLKPDVMAAGGGSLVIEQRLKDSGTYRVHWAGARSSSGSQDCGRSADLMLSAPDMQLLSNAVGGPGLHHWSLADL